MLHTPPPRPILLGLAYSRGSKLLAVPKLREQHRCAQQQPHHTVIGLLKVSSHKRPPPCSLALALHLACSRPFALPVKNNDANELHQTRSTKKMQTQRFSGSSRFEAISCYPTSLRRDTSGCGGRRVRHLDIGAATLFPPSRSGLRSRR